MIFLLMAAAVMLACMPSLAPAPTPLPTFDPNALGTNIAETANAAASQTQVFITPSATPTFTPTVTRTPSDTPTPTPTFLFVLPTIALTSTFVTGQPGATDYACTVLAQAPEDNSLIGPGALFSVRWQVKNTGAVAWDANSVDYRYKSGTKMHMKPMYDLYKSVMPGDVADIIVDMTSPANPDVYTTTWKMRVGKMEFCTLTLTINVK
jgi:hypothetical protein